MPIISRTRVSGDYIKPSFSSCSRSTFSRPAFSRPLGSTFCGPSISRPAYCGRTYTSAPSFSRPLFGNFFNTYHRPIYPAPIYPTPFASRSVVYNSPEDEEVAASGVSLVLGALFFAAALTAPFHRRTYW